MLASVTVTTASADTVNLSDKTVTLSVTPSQSAICVGSTGDVYVKYTISIEADAPIPAFSFVVPTDGKLATTATDLVWRFQLNTKLKQSQGGPYNTADYNPAKGYVGVGGSDNNGITEKTTVMTIVAKFPAGAKIGTYTPAFEKKDFIAGDGEAIDGTDGVKVSNAFGTRNVEVDSVTMNPGATVSGTVKDSSGKAVSGATVELCKDGKAVAKEVTTGANGKYTISNVSTGTYTLKAKGSDGALNGSAEITVKADSIPDAHVTVAKGFTVSGTAVSWNATNDALYYLYPSTMEDADIKAEWKSGSYTGTACTGKGTPTASGKQFEQTFTFDTVAAGNYKLVIFKPGKYVPKIVSITVESTALDLGRLKLWLYGDVNYDGKVNGTDAVQIQRSYASKIPNVFSIGSEQDISDRKLCADVNHDGKINGTDAVQIQRYYANKAPSAFTNIK